MRNLPNVEQVGPQARLQAELVQLQSQKWEFWVLVMFAAAVLLLGFLSFFFPRHFWSSGGMHFSVSPQVLFVIMVVIVLAAWFTSAGTSRFEGCGLPIFNCICPRRRGRPPV